MNEQIVGSRSTAGALMMSALLLSASCKATGPVTSVFMLEGEQTPNGLVSEELDRTKDYFNVSIRTMRLHRHRIGFSKYYATAYGNFAFLYKGERQEFAHVTDPSKFSQIDARNQERIAYFNQKLLGPIPYRGGSIDTEIGLFAVKSTDLSEPYLTLLNNAATTVGTTPSIAAALPFIKVIKDGIKILTGTEGTAILQAAYDSEWETPKTGYYVVIRDPDEEFVEDDLQIVVAGSDEDLELADSKGNPIRDVSYTIFSVTRVEDHDYWVELPGIKDTYQDMYELLANDKEEEARKALAALERMIMTSWEIHPPHGRRIVQDIIKDGPSGFAVGKS